MKGAYEVTVRNNRVQYRFTIHRNITVLRGNSATGKTTLIGLIAQYERSGNKSGVQLTCRRNCAVLTSEFWEEKISKTENSLLFIDEDSDFIRTREFAAAARQSGCYFIIVSRITLSDLPYSVDEIYELRNVTRGYGKIRRLYTEFQRIYSGYVPGDLNSFQQPDCVIVEDTNSGFQFFQQIFARLEIPVKSANGNSGVCEAISYEPEGSTLLIIADGAAYGPYIEKTLAQRRKWNIVLFLPESFEWMILNSGLIDGRETRQVLDNPSDHIESSQFFSWERFFTAYLTQMTKGTYLQYSKRNLNPVYLQEHEKNAIMKGLPDEMNRQLFVETET